MKNTQFTMPEQVEKSLIGNGFWYNDSKNCFDLGSPHDYMHLEYHPDQKNSFTVIKGIDWNTTEVYDYATITEAIGFIEKQDYGNGELRYNEKSKETLFRIFDVNHPNEKPITMKERMEAAAQKAKARNESREQHSDSVYKEITINEKLILDETEKAYFTRIPHTKKYIWFDKDQCDWTSVERKTLHINVGIEQQYDFVDKNGEFLETITGDKIHEFYDDAEKKRTEQRTSEPRLKVEKSVTSDTVQAKKSSIPGAKKVPFSNDKRFAYVSRKQQIATTKEMAAMLVLIRREGITKDSDFSARIDNLQEQCKTIKGDIRQLESKNSQNKEAAEYLVTYNKYLPIKQLYEHQPRSKKKSFYSSNESYLLAFDDAAKQLEQWGLSTDIDPDKVVELVQRQTETLTELHSKYKQTESRIDELQKAQEMVQKIIQQQVEVQKDIPKEINNPIYGKQSIKQLNLDSIPITTMDLKGLQRELEKSGVDYSVKKNEFEKDIHDVYFKVTDIAKIQAALKTYMAKSLEERSSLKQRMESAVQKAKDHNESRKQNQPRKNLERGAVEL